MRWISPAQSTFATERIESVVTREASSAAIRHDPTAPRPTGLAWLAVGWPVGARNQSNPSCHPPS